MLVARPLDPPLARTATYPPPAEVLSRTPVLESPPLLNHPATVPGYGIAPGVALPPLIDSLLMLKLLHTSDFLE